MWVYSAAHMCNPLFVAEKQVAPLNAFIDDLQGFQFSDISTHFLEFVNNELPLYPSLVHNTRDDDWA